MRIIDAVPEEIPLHKAFLVEEGGRYAILHRPNGRPPKIGDASCLLGEVQALSEWKDLVIRMFFRVTKNKQDSEALAERRIAAALH